jgi:hypothetical protein
MEAANMFRKELALPWSAADRPRSSSTVVTAGKFHPIACLTALDYQISNVFLWGIELQRRIFSQTLSSQT